MPADTLGAIAEAARLLAAFSSAERPKAHDGGDQADAGSCRWCPHCHAAGLSRDVSPEARAQLAATATGLVLALRDAVDQAGRAPAERAHRNGAPADAATDGPEPAG